MNEPFEYSRRKVAESTQDVLFAAPRRVLLYVLSGLFFAVAAWALARHVTGMSPDEFRTISADWLFVAICVPVLVWAAFGFQSIMDRANKKD